MANPSHGHDDSQADHGHNGHSAVFPIIEEASRLDGFYCMLAPLLGWVAMVWFASCMWSGALPELAHPVSAESQESSSVHAGAVENGVESDRANESNAASDEPSASTSAGQEQATSAPAKHGKKTR